MKTRSMNTDIIPMEDFYKVRQFIAEKFNMTPESISAKHLQDDPVFDARKCLAFVLVRHYLMSYTSAGKLIGKNHSTVLNCLRKYHQHYDSDKKFRKKANEIVAFVKIHISKRPQLCPFCNHEIKNEDK